MAPNGGDRPIVIRRVKKVVGGGHHGGAWKVAYADFVTAMMAFFMLLWLISNPDKEMLKGLAEYFTASDPGSAGPGMGMADRTSAANSTSRASRSGSQTSTGEPAMNVATAGAARGGTANIPDAALRVMAQELKIEMESAAREADAADSVKFEEQSNSLTISLMDTAKRPMFQGSTARLNSYAVNMLARIARKVGGTGVSVSVQGHTDAGGGLSEANWRLSGERALSARNAMVAAGLSADRFTGVTAMASTRPVFPDQPSRPENRRIAIVLEALGSALPPDTSFQF